MNSYTRTIVLTLLLSTLLLGCSGEAPAAVKATAYPPVPVDTPLPTGYPGPTLVPTGTPVTQQPELGRVKGRLLRKGQAAANVKLGLGAILKNRSGEEQAAAYDRATSPQAACDGKGNFEFLNVRPGRYGLFYANQEEAFLMKFPGKEEMILLTVEGNKAADLGVLDMQDLP